MLAIKPPIFGSYLYLNSNLPKKLIEMKRVLSLRKRIMAGVGLLVLLFTAYSFTFCPVVNAPLVGNTPQNKVQRVKVVVKKDGKETKIDTTFNLPDEKMISFKVDSMLKKMDVKRIIRSGNDRSISIFDGPEGDEMLPPPPPPMSPNSQFIIHKRFGDPFAFDSKDPSVISYEKKDIGKGLEKITIIRKKQTGHNQDKEVNVRVETSTESKK